MKTQALISEKTKVGFLHYNLDFCVLNLQSTLTQLVHKVWTKRSTEQQRASSLKIQSSADEAEGIFVQWV